jgi:hypothetical protein
MELVVMIRIGLISMSLCLLFIVDLNGAEPIEISKISSKVRLEYMDQYIDSSSNLSYEEFMLNKDLFHSPAYLLQGTRNRKFSYWMTFTLVGEMLTQEDFYFICTDNRISHMELWIDGKAQTDNPIGTDYLFENRQISHSSLVYALLKNEEQEVVIKIKSNQSTFFAFEVKTENQFRSDSHFTTGLLGSAYGLVLLGVFFSLFMLLKFRESIYLNYPFFALVSIVIFLLMDGGGFQYLWLKTPSVNLYLLLFLPILLIFSLGFLVLSVLEAWDKKNPFFKIIMGSMFIGLLGYIFVFTLPQYFIHNVFYIIPFIAMIYCCIMIYKAGDKPVLAFIIGFVFVVLTNSMYMAQPFYAAKHYSYFIQFSPHFGVVILSLALIYSQFMKFYLINESRKSERKKSIEQLEQLNQIKDRINEEIAEKVAQQTNELELKNSVIHIQNAELLEANDKLKVQTDEIVNLNLQLDQENQELKSDVQKIKESRLLQNTIPFDDIKSYFNSEDACYNLLEDLKWQKGFECLKCGNEKYSKGKGERARRCTKCGTNESITSNTIFHRLHFSILKGFYLLFLVNKHGDTLVSKDLSEIVDLRLATCWKFSKKIKDKKIELEQSGKVIESWLELI